MPDEALSRSAGGYGPLTERDVLEAARDLVAAFRATDTAAYFASFSADATFVFHTEEHRLDSRARYEDLWRGWLAGGWQVTECVSTNAMVQLLGGTAVFTHDVRTTTSTGGTQETTQERETIVFQQTGDGGIMAVHEHLGPVPMSPDE